MPLILYRTVPAFIEPGKYVFKNVMGTGEHAGNQHFLLFPCLLSIEGKFHNLIHNKTAFKLGKAKILSCGKGLKDGVKRENTGKQHFLLFLSTNIFFSFHNPTLSEIIAII